MAAKTSKRWSEKSLNSYSKPIWIFFLVIYTQKAKRNVWNFENINFDENGNFTIMAMEDAWNYC